MENNYKAPRFTTHEIMSIVERELPQFAEACKSNKADFVLMTQAAFAADYLMGELLVLGFAIKYAELYDKEVRIITRV